MLQSVDSASHASSPAPKGVACPACGTENSANSRFCRQCGSALTTTAQGAASNVNNTSLPLSTPIPVTPLATTPEEDGGMDTHGHSISEEIDARRAKQLLDRALHLGERNEIQAAILACRQAIALSPTAAGGYSMLGMLLERANDLRGAIQAYERVLALSPHSALERDSLARLYDRLEQNPSAYPAATHSVPDLPSSAPAVIPVTPGAVDPVLDGAPAPDDRRNSDRRQVSVPVAVERRRRDRRADTAVAAAATAATVTAAATPIAASSTPIARTPAALQPKPAPSRLLQSPLMMQELGEPRPSVWQQLSTNPSFYWRGMPLVATVALSLGFLLWARSYAVERRPAVQVENISGTTTTNVDPTTPETPVQGTTTSTQPNNNGVPEVPRPVNPNPPVLITNRPNAQQPRPAGGTTPSRPATNRGGNSGSTPPVRSLQSPPLIPPAPIPQSSGPSSLPNNGPSADVTTDTPRTETPANNNRPSADNGGGLTLPPPRVTQPQPADEPVRVLPPDTNPGTGVSSGGVPLNPAGSPARGYIRVSPARVPASAPVRPSASARNDESRAASAARGGQSDAAIVSLNTAISNSDPSDLGYRYQQRASLFMERGEYSRAADDFQSAISAYNDQINRGEQVPQARAGLRASRNGLNLAISSARRG